jgi:hypothetical protein
MMNYLIEIQSWLTDKVASVKKVLNLFAYIRSLYFVHDLLHMAICITHEINIKQMKMTSAASDPGQLQ